MQRIFLNVVATVAKTPKSMQYILIELRVADESSEPLINNYTYKELNLSYIEFDIA